MELRELNRAFDQFSPTQEQKEAIRARLLHAERKSRPMKWMKKTIAVAAAAAVLLKAGSGPIFVLTAARTPRY